MSSKYVIQKLVLPNNSKHEMCRELFFRGTDGFLDRQNNTLQLGRGQKCDFTTYINGCSWQKWKKYTSVKRIFLNIDVEGSYKIVFVGYSSYFKKPVRKEYGVIRGTEKERQCISFCYEDSDDIILGFELEASGDCTLYGGYYETEYDGELNDIRLSLCTTTYHKEEYIKSNIARIKKELIDTDDEMSKNFTVHVADNGRTLENADIVGKNVFLHPNKNTGGSGGFARGMIESLHQEKKATHIILMDDDVLILPESIRKTFCLLRLLKQEYRECFISGAMLCYEEPTLQFEDVGSMTGSGTLQPCKQQFNLTLLDNVIKNETEYYNALNMYAGWWYCCIPTKMIEEKGLPLPLFIRGDDIEYSLRCKPTFISMNGICIWHMSFGAKYNGAVDSYLTTRNHHIIKAACDAMVGVGVHELYLDYIKRRFYKFEYDGIELLLDAVEDYLNGPKYVFDLDDEKVLKNESRLNDKMEDLRNHPELPICFAKDYCLDAPRKFRDKILFHLTDNGQRCCPEFLYKKGGPQIVPYDYMVKYQKISLVKEYAAIEFFSEEVIFRRLDKQRYADLKKRFHNLEKEYKKNHERVDKEYKEFFEQYTSEEFWRKKLEI